jgi:hypothetical protein
MLHATVTDGRHRYAFLETHCSEDSSCFRVFHELGMIFPNTKDEMWTQHKYLHGKDKEDNTIIDLSSRRFWSLWKWWGLVRCSLQTAVPIAVGRNNQSRSKKQQQNYDERNFSGEDSRSNYKLTLWSKAPDFLLTSQNSLRWSTLSMLRVVFVHGSVL